MLVTMKDLLSGYNIDLSTIHEAQNAKVLCLFTNAASIGPFFVQYCTMCLSPPITNIDHGSRWPHPRQVGARYGRPVAQKIAIGLL